MQLSYYNPFLRLKLFSKVWEMAGTVHDKLNRENPNTAPSRLAIFFDYLQGWIAHGFSIVQYHDYEIYKVRRCVRKNIVTNRRALKLEKIYNNTNDTKWIENKALFNEKFKTCVKRKWLLMKDASESDFISVLGGIKKVIIKPTGGERGEGIYIKEVTDSKLQELYNALRGKDFLVEEVIKQNDEMAFGRTSVNTIRMYTLLDDNGNAHLLKSVLRVGAPGNDVDNYHCGGSIWPLDRNDGFVECAGKTLAVSTPIYNLPLTGEFMLGYRIPNYQKAVQAVLESAKLIPTVRYIGWDVAITDVGVEIIEANSSPDNDFHCLGVERNYYKRLLDYK